MCSLRCLPGLRTVRDPRQETRQEVGRNPRFSSVSRGPTRKRGSSSALGEASVQLRARHVARRSEPPALSPIACQKGPRRDKRRCTVDQRNLRVGNEQGARTRVGSPLSCRHPLRGGLAGSLRGALCSDGHRNSPRVAFRGLRFPSRKHVFHLFSGHLNAFTNYICVISWKQWNHTLESLEKRPQEKQSQSLSPCDRVSESFPHFGLYIHKCRAANTVIHNFTFSIFYLTLYHEPFHVWLHRFHKHHF